MSETKNMITDNMLRKFTLPVDFVINIHDTANYKVLLVR